MRTRRWLTIGLLGWACANNPAPGEHDAATDVVRTATGPNEAVDLTRQTLLYSQEFAQPWGHVWNTLVETDEDLGMPLESADTTTGAVVFRLQTSTPRIAGKHASLFLDCGRGPGGTARVNSYQLTLRLTAHVEHVGSDRTLVRTGLVGYARDRATTADPLLCSSTGALEKRALAILLARLGP
jgi:hypothetical protein